MKTFTNSNPRGLAQAFTTIQQAHTAGHSAAIAGGGSDLLGMIKDQLAAPDVVVNLKAIRGLDAIQAQKDGLHIGGLATLDSLARHAAVRSQYTVLGEAAESVATPQIRNVGTIAGNIAQRPWCWYYRNGFPCFKAGGNECFSIAGENRFHAILGGGPSFIVHPSDTAPALVALEAKFHISGSAGNRSVAAADFFVLPSQNAEHENVLAAGEVLTAIELPSPRPGTRSTYYKVMDREAWTHAIVSAAIVLEIDGNVCRSARIVLGGVAPIPWRVPDAERALAGQTITTELAAKVAAIALAGASPLAHNAYKVPMTRNIVRRTVLELAQRA